MLSVNFINEIKAFLDFASVERLSDSSIVLWLAFFLYLNQRAKGNNWPVGFTAIPNSKLLGLTPWGCGKSAEEKLIRTRVQLINAGLIEYTAGKRNKAPQYRFRYFCAQNTTDNTQKYKGNGWGNHEGNDQGDMQGNVQGNTLGNAPGNVQDIKDKDGNPNSYSNDSTHVGQQQDSGARVRGGAASWHPGSKPRPGNYMRQDGTMGVCRFDSGWETSDKARGAIAQRLMDGWGGHNDIDNLHSRLCELMLDGLPPEVIEDVMPSIHSANLLVARLNALLIGLGYEAARADRERQRQWTADLHTAKGNIDLAKTFQRIRRPPPDSES